MTEPIQFLVLHGYTVLCIVVFAEQVGLPLPAAPLLLAAGALTGSGTMNLPASISLAVVAAIMADLVWYGLGRQQGSKVLSLLCRISIEPDSCVRRTENVFVRHGPRSLVIANLVPGLSTVAPPLAGIFGMRVSLFFLFDGLGAFLWVGTYTGLGYVFSDQLDPVVVYALQRAPGSWCSW